MSEIKIGVVTDSHMGGFDSCIAEALKKEEVDRIEYLGDATKNIRTSPQEQFDDIAATLKIYNNVGVPVSWIPGNYEDFDAYHAAFQQLEDDLDNVVDATRLGKYTLKINGIEVDLVWIPGARDFSRGFRVRDDFPTGDYCIESSGQVNRVHNFNPHDLETLVTNPEGTIVLAHNPIQMSRDDTFDFAMHAIYQGQEEGGPAARELIRSGFAKPKPVHSGNPLVGRIIDKIGIKKYISGDIHEAVFTTDRQGRPVPPGTFSRELFGNPGPAKDGRYGVLVYRDDRMATLYSKSVKSLEAVREAKGRKEN